MKTLHFFLGGRDLETVTITQLLNETWPGSYSDYGLSWGARSSAYESEIRAALAANRTPVLVELEDDLGLPKDSVIVVDHHGDRSGDGRPTSLHQVFALLALPRDRWTRWFELVAANDSGHVNAMLDVGATPDELRRVRASDRAAQGITPEQERAGEEAARSARSYENGDLLVVDLPHNRTATVTDRLHRALGGPGYENLLICSPDEVNFYGSGDLVHLLSGLLPGGWRGGDTRHGFWGAHAGHAAALGILISALKDRRGANQPSGT